MTVCALSIVAGFMASGCQKGTTIQRFARDVENAKSIRMEAVLKEGSESRPVRVARKLPNQGITVSKNLTAVVSDLEGALEVDFDEKKYIAYPWLGKFAPFVGKLIPASIVACHPAYGVSPFKISPVGKWTVKKKGNLDVWTTQVESPMGLQTFEVELDSEAKLKRYLGPDGEFTVSKWELNGSIPDQEFKVRVPDGFVMKFLPPQYMDLAIGRKVDFSKFVDNKTAKIGPAWSLVLFSDPSDPLSAAMKGWLAKVASDAAKIEVSLGSGGDYSVPDEKAFWKLVTATPTLALINSKGEIMSLWQGFDSAESSKLEQEISKAIKEHS